MRMHVWILDCHAADFRVLVYRERYDENNILGELILRPDCTFRQVRQIIAEVSPSCRVLLISITAACDRIWDSLHQSILSTATLAILLDALATYLDRI